MRSPDDLKCVSELKNDGQKALTIHKRSNQAKTAFCIIAVLCLSIQLFLQEYSDPKLLWGLLDHDRHAHYGVALSLANSLQRVDLFDFVREVDGCRVWPPLHALIVGFSIASFGLDYRTAFVPNLCWWMGTAILLFLIVRKASPRWGNVGGVIAVWLFCSSPIFKMFATDVMLEQLGAFLLLACVLLYIRAKELPTHVRYAQLAMALTALFFEKYNFWTIACLSILIFELIDFRSQIIRWIRDQISKGHHRLALRSLIRDPFHWVALIFLCALVAGVITKSTLLGLSDRRFSFRKDHYIPLAGYATLVGLLALHAWRNREWLRYGLDSRVRAIAVWNVLPIIVSFLLPGRLGHFLWFMIDLEQNVGPVKSHGISEGYAFYAKAIRDYFHFTPWMMWLALCLSAIGLITMLVQRSRFVVVGGVLALAAFLTFSHPNCQDRHACVWMPLLWALAGIGAASVLSVGSFVAEKLKIAGNQMDFLARLHPAIRISGVMVATAILLATLPGLWSRGKSQELVDQRYFPSSQKIFDLCLSRLDAEDRVTFFASLPLKKIARWKFLEKVHDPENVEFFIKGFGTDEAVNRERFAKWEQSSKANKVVFLDIPEGTPFYFQGFPQYKQFTELLLKNGHWHCEVQTKFEDSNVGVWIWSRPIPGQNAMQTAQPERGPVR